MYIGHLFLLYKNEDVTLDNDKGWKSFEVNVRKSLGCLEETAGRNLGVKGDYSEDGGRKEERHRESISHLRECIYHQEQSVGRNMTMRDFRWK